jgi:chromosome segregation ATPase
MKHVSRWVVVGGMLIGGIALAASLSDFKDAVGKEGCDSIPYDGIRSTCKGRSADVDDWCKRSDRKISCDDLDPKGLQKQIDNVKQKISTLKKERDDVASKIGNSKDDPERKSLEEQKKKIEDTIYDLENKVSAWETTLSDEKREIDNRIYNGDRCVGYREEVAKAFADAKSSAKGETDPDIKPYAAQLVQKWEAGESGHAGAITKYKEAVQNCKNLR